MMHVEWRSVRYGFTLVELSIVLVILGLLVGGVLAGQSLVRASELRAVGTEYDKFRTSLNAFKDKYFYLPGDLLNATKYWGAQAGATTDGVVSACTALDHTTPSTGTATCNGDGNGAIADVTATNIHERFRAWQHLANAGLIEGTFTGVRGSGGIAEGVIGSNIPRSKINGGGWYVTNSGVYAGDANIFASNYGTVMYFGAAVATSAPFNPIMKPEEAYNIDMKLDDGLPHQGMIMTRKNGATYTPNCVVAAQNAYALSASGIECMLYFKTGY